jgi:hypothetical protein
MHILGPAEVTEELWFFDSCVTCGWESESVPQGDPDELESQDAYYHHCTGEKNLMRQSFIIYYANCFACSWEIVDGDFSEEDTRGLVNRHNQNCLG